MRLIDCHKAKRAIYQHKTQRLQKETVLKILDSAPTIDAVPVVRCKDCIDYEPELGTDLGWCPVCSFVRWGDDFCSYGERKETDND